MSLWLPTKFKMHVLTATPRSCAPVIVTLFSSMLEPENLGTWQSLVFIEWLVSPHISRWLNELQQKQATREVYLLVPESFFFSFSLVIGTEEHMCSQAVKHSIEYKVPCLFGTGVGLGLPLKQLRDGKGVIFDGEQHRWAWQKSWWALNIELPTCLSKADHNHSVILSWCGFYGEEASDWDSLLQKNLD